MAKTQTKKRNRRAKNGRDINEYAEQLLGQMMFAIGQGADGAHIHRTAVAKMRERYEPTTYKFVEDDNPPGWKTVWQLNAIYTLRYFEVIGRLAAQYATNDGSPSIDARHFEQARVVVEATYRAEASRRAPQVAGSNRGDICPPSVTPPPPPPPPPPAKANGRDGRKKQG